MRGRPPLVRTTKCCSNCGEVKDRHLDFYRGDSSWCRDCQIGRVKPCGDCGGVKDRQGWVCSCCLRLRLEVRRKTERDRHRQVNYGITPSEFGVIFAAQGGRCAACRTPLVERAKGTHLDHDHSTGALRGILCRDCNTAAGLLKDDWRRVRALSQYLRRGGTRLPLNDLLVGEESA
jgi:hypothetical protein